MSKLDDRCTRVCGSVNFKDYTAEVSNLLVARFVDTLSHYSKCGVYYIIPHHETETFHIHYILLLKSQQTLLRVINVLSEGLKVDTVAVNCQKLANLGKHLAYIVHQDKESEKLGKLRYEVSDIISNESTEIIQSYIDNEDDEIDSFTLINICLDCNDEIEVMNRIGLKTFHKYRYEIRLVFDNILTLRAKRQNDRDISDVFGL